MTRKVLLGCGVASSLLYIAADIVASRRYEGYSYRDQAFSELLAAGASTRPLMIALMTPYNLLVLALAAGMWAVAGQRRAARIAAVLLAGYAVTGAAGGFLFNMDPRGAEMSTRGGLHGPATLVMSLFILSAMGFAATLFGRRFRRYTYATIVVLVVFGALTGLYVPRLEANEPTPWMGLVERVNVYATMLWLAALAGAALRRGQSINAPHRPGQRAATPRLLPR